MLEILGLFYNVIQELRNNILQQLHPPGNLFTGCQQLLRGSGQRLNDSRGNHPGFVKNRLGSTQQKPGPVTNGATATKSG